MGSYSQKISYYNHCKMNLLHHICTLFCLTRQITEHRIKSLKKTQALIGHSVPKLKSNMISNYCQQ